jgi:hypothetical protein
MLLSEISIGTYLGVFGRLVYHTTPSHHQLSSPLVLVHSIPSPLISIFTAIDLENIIEIVDQLPSYCG